MIFRDGPNWSIPLHSAEPLWIDITSDEPYMTLELNYTIDGQWREFTIAPQSTQHYYYEIEFDVEGEVTYQVNIEYNGVVVCADTITVAGVPGIPFGTWWLLGCLILIIGYKKKRRSK